MASYKSQTNVPRRTEGPTLYSYRAHTTRLPQRSVTPTSVTPSQLPTLAHSKLQKKRSTRDEQTQPTREATSQRVPVPTSSIGVKARQSSAPAVPGSRRPSNKTLPKPLPHAQLSRLPTLEAVGTTRTPSLISGSSTSTVDSPRSNVLRRKPTSIGMPARQGSRPRVGSMSSQEEGGPSKTLPGGFKDPFSETVLGISLPPSSSILARADAELEISGQQYHEYEIDPREILTLPTPQYAVSTTPSTRYSESPGPFSVSSTPTSMSSYSPATAISSKSTTRVRQASPLQSRPPVVRHNTADELGHRQRHALSSVRESSNSASSASTVVAESGRAKIQESPNRAPVYSPPTTTAPRAQAPPELAHLAHHNPTSSVDLRRPVRPSRTGAEMIGLREPSPVIQSNMTSFPSSHRRTSSTDSKLGNIMNGRNRFGLPSKPSSRNQSPSPALTPAPLPTSRLPTREPTPDIHNGVEKTRSQSNASTVQVTAPSPSKTSRFGFFRRTKTEPAPTVKPDKKLHRRGPAAGTGHEGYGRYAVRGRSGSSVSGDSIGKSASAGTTAESLNRTSSSRKSSVTSATSTEVDDFFLERLAPITIRGAGSSAELSRSPDPMASGSSLDVSGALGEGQKGQNSSTRAALESKRPTLLPSAMSDPVRGMSPMKRTPLSSRRPSESDDDTKRSFLPSLATRRTSRASRAMDGAPLAKMASAERTAEGQKTKVKKEKVEKAPSKPSKWNFFQRAHAAPKMEPPVVKSSTPASRVPQSRSVAHYALIDSKPGIDLEDIEQLMKEADSALEEPAEPEEDVGVGQLSAGVEGQERQQSMLLPPMPIFTNLSPPARPASPKVYLRPEPRLNLPQRKLSLDTSFNTTFVDLVAQGELTPVTDLSSSPSSPFGPLSPVEPKAAAEQAPSTTSFPPLQSLPPHGPIPGPPPAQLPPRPSRLAQVGRIPQVVSRRNQEHRPPHQSFSRPFATNQPHPNVLSRTSFESPAPLTITSGPVEPFPTLQGIGLLSHGSAIATLSPSAEESSRQSEFFKFPPPRKDSEVSYSSSSGVWSFPPTSGIAVTGGPQSEDEIWGEYDDLIDEVLSPLSAGTGERAIAGSKSLPCVELSETNASRMSGRSEVSNTGPANPSLHLRRSRLLAVLHSAQSPTSPMSLSDFLQDYGDRNLSIIDPVTGRLSFPTSNRFSTVSAPRDRANSARSSLPASLSLSARQSKATLASNSDRDRGSASTNRYRDTRLMELAETQTNGIVSMADLRFGALMTSKWLSFGRVLFSPAHFELKDPSEDRILVIDGLGKDWSYYCALTYSEATIYNLGPGPSSSSTLNSGVSEPWSTLRNHHHVGLESLASAFPFPQGFFSCVVIRFPTALPSSVHRSVISECKRVLRPGGHLEFSVLDLDLVNMGNRARRAVRSLKVKMHVQDENISLRNISDEIMAGLGRKGFTECNRCFVGVPVAGRLPSPEDNESGKKRKGSTASSVSRAKSTASKTTKSTKPEVSFSDLLNKHTSSDSTDQGITDMVARVGRWWYSRCYESLVLPEAGEPGAATSGNLLQSSIWRDENLIRECEKRGTTFRLLIGYAQKPEIGVRRTVSV